MEVMKIKHLLWWMLSEDEKTVLIRSEIVLQIFGRVIPLSERKMQLKANYCGCEVKKGR
jgi:hypothetical protein